MIWGDVKVLWNTRRGAKGMRDFYSWRLEIMRVVIMVCWRVGASFVTDEEGGCGTGREFWGMGGQHHWLVRGLVATGGNARFGGPSRGGKWAFKGQLSHL